MFLTVSGDLYTVNMKSYVVAVSGGVDSVVLLDMLAKKPDLKLIVAHFDHGIRTESKTDANFVKSLADKYDLPFETKREELGTGASEDLARSRRYKFLRSVAEKYGAQIVTAHHADDVIETIAINLSRGTGWRGLAVLDSDIVRPLTDMTKTEIINYAKEKGLSWREDKTNADEKYLRNRIRGKLVDLDDDSKRQLLGLWQQQKYLKNQIEEVVMNLISTNQTYERKIFVDLENSVALELLRHITNAKLTRPQLVKALNAVKNFLPAKTLQAGGGIELVFTSRNFTVKLIK